jgi:hypothetical protein
LAPGRRRITANLSKGLAVELHDQSVGGFVWCFIDMPTWTQKEKLNGQVSRFLVVRGLTAIDGVVANPVYDLATPRAVRQNLDDAGRVVHILPVTDIRCADNRVLAVVGLDHVRDLIDREDEKNYEHDRGDTKCHRATETSCAALARRRRRGWQRRCTQRI